MGHNPEQSMFVSKERMPQATPRKWFDGIVPEMLDLAQFNGKVGEHGRTIYEPKSKAIIAARYLWFPKPPRYLPSAKSDYRANV